MFNELLQLFWIGALVSNPLLQRKKREIIYLEVLKSLNSHNKKPSFILQSCKFQVAANIGLPNLTLKEPWPLDYLKADSAHTLVISS
jgi:hypothetical protein